MMPLRLSLFTLSLLLLLALFADTVTALAPLPWPPEDEGGQGGAQCGGGSGWQERYRDLHARAANLLEISPPSQVPPLCFLVSRVSLSPSLTLSFWNNNVVLLLLAFFFLLLLLLLLLAVQWEQVLEQQQVRIAVALVREGKFRGQFSGGVGDRFTGLITVSQSVSRQSVSQCCCS